MSDEKINELIEIYSKFSYLAIIVFVILLIISYVVEVVK